MVNRNYLVTMATNTHEEVVGFDIAVNEIFGVNIFNATNHLIGQHQDSLHGETTRTEIEQIF